MTTTSDQSQAIIEFMGDVFGRSGRHKVVIGVSGGIDSAVALTLLTKALPQAVLLPVLLPYGDQDMSDAKLLLEHLNFPPEQILILNVEPIVAGALESLAPVMADADSGDQLRQGNLRARARMIVLFDLAHRHQALVCGTENKSEKFLGYFTRFGDAASDFEPLSSLYKTQVRQLAAELGVPEIIQRKEPSAGLWAGQTDQAELGFSYEVADKVLEQVIDLGVEEASEIEERVELDLEVVERVMARVKANHFKHQVPYVL